MRLALTVALLAILVATVVFPGATSAETWRVERDGTGDFDRIQPALDAVASGDTLLIGPGEYLEATPSYIPGYAWDVDVYAFVRVSELTIVGAGATETVIGPAVFSGSTATFSPKGLVWLEGTALRISGVTLRNCYCSAQLFCPNF